MAYVGKITDTDGVTGLVGSTLYGTCATAAGTAAKVVTCADFDELLTGVTIHVKFTNGNTVASPTLNVNSTGAKAIFRFGTNAGSTSLSWTAGQVVAFTYDGTQWHINDAAGAVYQSASTTSNYRSIMLSYNSSTTVSDPNLADSKVTGQVYANEHIFAQPSTGKIFAKEFVALNTNNTQTASLHSGGLWLKSYIEGASATYNYNETVLKTYAGKLKSNNGMLITLQGGGLTIVGGGESATSLANLIDNDQSTDTTETPTAKLDVGGTLDTKFVGDTEQLLLSSDNNIYFITACQTIANRKPVVLDMSLQFYPGTTNTGSIGTSSYKWGSVYATNINGKLYTTATNPSSETLYYIPFISGATSGNYDQLVNDGFGYRSREGSTSQDGFGVGVFGNGTASGTAGNKYGVVRIYGTGAYYSQIKTDAASSNKTVLMPNMAGNFSILNKNSTSYWGLYDGDASGSNWIRTTTNGFIPVEAGGLDNPHSSLGTSSWAFQNAYIANIYTNKIFPGSGIYYNNASGFASAPWAKTVDFTCTTASVPRWYAFRVYQGYEGTTIGSGLLIVSITTNANKVYSSGKVVWVHAAGSLDKDNFAVTYTNTASTSTTIEIWAKCTKRYQGWNVIPLYGGWGSGKGDIGINCYSTTTGEAAYTGTLIASEYADIKNNAASADKINTDAGSTKQPVYFTGGVPTAIGYTIEKSVPSNAVFTDTKVTVTDIGAQGATSGSNIVFAAAGTSGVSISSTDMRFRHEPGTTSAVGVGRISLGNSTASGTANNSKGSLMLYSANTGYALLEYANTTNQTTHTLPATGGTILNTGTTSFTQSLSSGTKIGTIKINGTSTDLYCETNTNTDTNVTQTNTASTNANYRVLLSANANDTTETTTARKNTNLYYNPSTGVLRSARLTLQSATMPLISLNLSTLQPTAGQNINVIGITYRNSDNTKNYTAYPIGILGNDASDGNNTGVRLGSQNGTTIIGAGESSVSFAAAKGKYNDENIYLVADGSVFMYRGMSNDSTTGSGPWTMGGFTATPVDGQVVVADGTVGGYKTSGYTIAKSVPSNAVFTDENVTSELIASSDTSTSSFYPTLVTGATNGHASYLAAIRFLHTAGTTSAVGNSRLILGNGTQEGTANNEEGLIRLYSAGSQHHTIQGTKTNTAYTHTLPPKTGTVINSGCVGTGLTWDSTNNALNHSSSVTAVSTAELKKLTYNASGHITGKANIASTDVDSLLTLCPTDTGIPDDSTYYISQSTAGTDVYNRRSVKYLWQYMFDKVVATYYNNNSGFASAPWAKVASTTITSGSAHRHIEFLVGQAFRDSTTTTSYFWGILAIRFNTTSSKVYGSGQVEWLVAHENLDKDNIVVTYTNVASTSTTIEIWAKTTVRYCGYTFRSLTGLGLGIANAIYTDWTFYDPTSGVATYTGTLITSSYSNLKNNAANVTGTVAIANGGTGATSRLNALKALTNESVGTNAQYFLTITTSWGKGGYTSVADAKTVLGLKSAAYTESSAYLASSTTYAGSSSAGGAATSANKLNTNAGSATQPVYFSSGVPVAVTQPASGAWWSSVPVINSSGVLEVGRYIDFHNTTASTANYNIRLDNASTTSLRFSEVNTTAGANFSPATTAKYDLGTSSLKWRYIYGDLNGKINITVATDDTYYIPFISSTSGYNTLSSNSDISFETSRGDTSSTGLSLLGLGNSTAEGSNGNAYGALKLYGLGSNYISLTAKNVTGSNKEIKLPNYAGTVMVTGTGTALTSANDIDTDTKDITKHWYATTGGLPSNTPATSYGYQVFNIPTTDTEKYQKQLLFGNTYVIPYMYRYLYNGSWSGGWRSPGTGFFYVIGTQTAATSAWTGVLPLPALYDGLTIAYYLPYAAVSTANVTLELTLSNGTTTGAKEVRYTNNSRFSTVYGAGSCIILTYFSASSVKVAGATTVDSWRRCDFNTNSSVNVTLNTTSKAYVLATTSTPTSTATARTAVADTGVYLDTTAGSLAATKFTVNNLIEIHDTSYTSRSVRLTYGSTASGTSIQHFPTCDGEIQVSQGQAILYSGTVNLTSTSGTDITISGDYYLEDFRMLLFEMYPPSGDGAHHIVAPWNYVHSQSPTVIWFQAVPEQNTSHMSTKSNFSVGVSYGANGKIHITPGTGVTGTWGIRIYSLI